MCPYTKDGVPFVPSDTSEAAAESQKPDKVGGDRGAILKAIRAAGPDGMTCDQVEQRLDMRHQTASARIRDLAEAKLIYDSGDRRETSTGRTARVYLATPVTG